MAQLVASDEIKAQHVALPELGRSLATSFQQHFSNSKNSLTSSSVEDDANDECTLLWAEIERLPTFERLRSSLFNEYDGHGADAKRKQVIDVTELGALERHMFVEKLIKHVENDNLRLLQKLRRRIDKVGMRLPTVEVRYKNLHVAAECEVIRGKPLPTLWNSLRGMLSGIAKLPGVNSKEAKISIINDVSGIIRPGRLTLLLGPPGCGKTSFLKALTGNLNKSLKVSGEVSYNGYNLKEFVPQKISAYVSQNNLHIPQMTVRETLDFSARCQGVGCRAEIMTEVIRREKEARIVPDPDLDTYMKAISVEGQRTTLQTDYILKILGLDICADTLYGDAMRRGISGGQKKRLTTGEMIVGPINALFMDEISSGLDSSTTYQIVACLQQLAHFADATILVSLLQPSPESFDLFDDIILMGEGKIVYHGPRIHVLEFFESCGFRCPERKGIADFLQEVISRKDQAQYWHRVGQSHSYVSNDMLCRNFKESSFGKKLDEEICEEFVKSESHKNTIAYSTYSISKWELFRACMSREFLLMQRNSFVYVFRLCQFILLGFITMTVFLRSRMDVDVVHANYYLGSLFFALVIFLVDGFPELSMTVARLPSFYKQRELCFYPAWAYAIPAILLKIPISLLNSLVWTSITYYVIGYSPEAGRFFRQFILLFAVHLTSISTFRFMASAFQTEVASVTASSLWLMFLLLFGGFIIPQSSMPVWLKWGFWASPLSYGEIGLAVNEFLAPRWQKALTTNTTIGRGILESRGLYFNGNLFWISVGALFGFTVLSNVGFTLTLTFLKPPGSRAIISSEKLSHIQGIEQSTEGSSVAERSKNVSHNTITKPYEGRMVLPFEPLTVVFEDVQYYVETPMEMRERGFPQKRLQLLRDITGSFRPGVLTALMGVTGAGKTTLLDVLSGRKTSGYIEGEIKIGGYPKVQETFARISGYCEQTDVHSPQITVEESLFFSAWLRLQPQIDSKVKSDFVKEVLETIELDGIKDNLVGMPGVSGLSTEQRKRLTIAVELVANPSVMFMDEPTTGLDARAAAIVMRAVKNVADTGRTIVCTIHQPSIDIFEAFDELFLLKSGGRMIYSGQLGRHSSKVIKYFEGVSGVPKIRDKHNPAAWMLEVTSISAEADLGIDFAEIYKSSALHEENIELVKSLSTPPPGTKDLHFPTRFSQNGWGQFKSCLWKQHLSYWRSPSYNLIRTIHMFLLSLLFGLLYWDRGGKINNQQSVLDIFGSMFTAVFLCGVNNCSSVVPYIVTERSVLYREKFCGMYDSWAYALAQVIIEVPYLFVQALIYVIITYPMIGYQWSASKVLWYFYNMLCTLMYSTYLGMMFASATPSIPLASSLHSTFYRFFNLFAGFIVPRPQIPKWWLWLYYLTPSSWTLNGMLTSQGEHNHHHCDEEEAEESHNSEHPDTVCLFFFLDLKSKRSDRVEIEEMRNARVPLRLSNMAELVDSDDIESRNNLLPGIGSSLTSSFQAPSPSSQSNLTSSSVKDGVNDEFTLLWAEIERLPTFERIRSSLFDDTDGDRLGKGKRVIDVTKLGALEQHLLIEKLIKHIENDNLRLLQKLRKRIDMVGMELPAVEVKYKNLHVVAECEVVNGKPLPTLWNSLQSLIFGMAKLPGLKSKEAKISIINDVSGIIKPGRMTLLLGPPGCGKTSLLKALSGNLNTSLKVSGEVSYNEHNIQDFVPQKASAYISQNNLHIPEMTVRETLDFSARCQGIGSRAEIMAEVSRREKQAGIVPDPDIDTYMKAIAIEGQKTTLQTDYIMKILGLDMCADTFYGNAMRRGISGGQKKRLTTGEMIVGPTKALFMDEISSGLDSSTTYQIIACLQQLAHIMDATVLVSLLQPAPESFDLFDDIILMAEGKIVYHGPRIHILEFFKGCGFRCPERKAAADFLQEVISSKDQAQYWHRNGQSHSYVSNDMLSRNFKESPWGKKLDEEICKSFMISESHKSTISFSMYSLSKWELFRACMSREFLLMRRNSFIYVFKLFQLVILSFITMTVFLRTQMNVDVVHANYYLGALFFTLIIFLVDGFPELSLTVARLPSFYKQRELCFYPAWAYAIPAILIKVPLSLLNALVWTSITYYVIGYSPEAGRFFRQFILLFAVHLTSISTFRFLASAFQTVVASVTAGSLWLLLVLLFGGFIIPQSSMPVWLKWAFWVSPLSYGEIGLAVNEFLAPRWQKALPANTTVGKETLESRGLDFNGHFFWICLGVLFGFTILFDVGFTLALTFLKPPGSRAIISSEKLSHIQGSNEYSDGASLAKSAKTISQKTITKPLEGRMVLPFEPLTVVFEDLQYYVETPMAMREQGFPQKRLQLLCDITGAFRPGVLTALMGVTGAGKTTLLDVLSGRKSSGVIEGEIKIGGYPKVQETFARISGYCEQSDVHSSQITVEESLVFSAWLRLQPQIDSKTKYDFVKEVLETIELDGIKDDLVGMPGLTGLSTEQRKRLTIAVELVANPSIIFMDEPTTGLDARAAAIVMRAVKNVADTGRTIVCTIHQPSIDIFEAFDELLLLKSGGRMIYSGQLGQHSSKVIEYFEGVPGVPKIRHKYNPATWMLEVTSASTEAELGIDFAQIYKGSSLYEDNKQLVKSLSTPPPGSKDLHFSTRFSQNAWRQFTSCLWKQHLSYWRSPSYNLIRTIYMLLLSLLFGLLYWDQGRKINNQQSVFNIFGSMFVAVLLSGINNCSSVVPYIITERSVLYREKFSGMYISWAYALAQVIIEVPYLFVQAITFVVTTYPMIGYQWSASKQIPKWWLWLYYLTPTSWTLNGMLTSQYGDVDSEILVFGEKKTVASFIRDYFGFHHDQLPIVALVLILYPLLFAFLFAYGTAKLNFARR
ncbi:hypothetical protein RJ640_009808 [Escallonia rubra]|uniref:ABC transporter domain-containing protein n=1 Tax=Escallonia rubra TaxID=112253 RepID=A0AA88QU80_9ASTE|nr:hypothetical protein RJ640_009808 [Escallonia rubra]